MQTSAVNSLFDGLARSLRPPEKLSYSEWATKHFRLGGNSAAVGRFRPWKFQRGILDAIGDPLLERVDIIKSARTGYTVSLVAALGATAINDPCPMILLMPTDDDARGIAVDEIDPGFRDSPELKKIMNIGRFDGRNTLTQRSLLGGGSLKILSAMAPRNLRRHTAKIIYCDEVDGMRITKEGDPIKIAEKRTISYPDRKIVCGSTPVDDVTSIIEKRYNKSDMRVFEIPCVHCHTPFELLWEHLDWEATKPETVKCYCPHCDEAIDERFKPEMVEAGEWRATAPHIKGWAGFRLNALISMFSNVSWVKLVEEYILAEAGGDADMQVFHNTNLGKTWSRSITYVNEHHLQAKVEDFGIAWDVHEQKWREDIPTEVGYITIGVDCQDNRLECTFVGWSDTQKYILGHHIIYGSVFLKSTWDELDTLLLTEWKHPLGGRLGIEAGFVDSSDGDHTQYVYDFCEHLQGQKIFSSKGRKGPHHVIEASKTRRRHRTAPLYLLATDTLRTEVLVSIALEKDDRTATRFSNTLETEFFVQITCDRRSIKYKDGVAEIIFERIGNRRAEARDCTAYAFAAKYLCRFNFMVRFEELKGNPVPGQSLKEIVKKLHS